MKLGRLTGKGRTAEVYQWGEGKVLKLFYPHIPRQWVEYEARVAGLVVSSGVPAPRVEGCIEIADRAGIIYEKIDGVTLLEYLMDNPQEGVHYAKAMAALHYRIHSLTGHRLPRQIDRFSRAIRKAADILGKRKADFVLSYIASLPNPSRVCHGDYHPGNLILGKELIPIDWMNAYSGSPYSDVARTCLMLRTPHVDLYAIEQDELAHMKQVIHDAYFEEYLRLSGAGRCEVEAWFLPVMAARLKEEVPGEREWLVNEIDKRLVSLRFR